LLCFDAGDISDQKNAKKVIQLPFFYSEIKKVLVLNHLKDATETHRMVLPW
jgi:hypothetical protein